MFLLMEENFYVRCEIIDHIKFPLPSYVPNTKFPLYGRENFMSLPTKNFPAMGRVNSFGIYDQ